MDSSFRWSDGEGGEWRMPLGTPGFRRFDVSVTPATSRSPAPPPALGAGLPSERRQRAVQGAVIAAALPRSRSALLLLRSARRLHDAVGRALLDGGLEAGEVV